MNNVLQIFLGSLPVLMAAIIMLIVKKKKLVPIAAIAIQLVVAITAVIFIGNNKMELSDTDAIDMYNVYNSIKTNPGQAENMLVKKNTFAGSIKYTLAKARLLALKGKWEEATALYKKVDSVDDSLLDKREKELLEKLQGGKLFTAKMLSYNVGNANYLKSQGQKPEDYGFVELSQEEINDNTEYLDKFQKEVVPEIISGVVDELEQDNEILSDIGLINAISDKVMSYDYNTYTGSTYSDSTNDNNSYNNSNIADGQTDGENSTNDNETENTGLGIYTELLKEDANELDEDSRKEYFKRLYDILDHYKKEYPELFNENQYLEAYIVACVRAGNKLDDLLENGDTKALQTVMDMYLAGIVTKDDFSKDFTRDYAKKYKEVIKQIKSVERDLRSSDDDYYVGDLKLKQAVDLLEENNEHILSFITDEIAEKIENNEISDNQLSESYISISISKNKQGLSNASIEYFNKAVEKGSESDNTVIEEAMDSIQEVYEDGNTDTNYIDMSEMVANAYTRSHHYNVATEQLINSVKSTTGTAISQTAAMIAIGRIDTEEFSKIKASVVYSSNKSLEDVKVTLKDCDIEIKDFDIQKKEYDGSEVILLCDVSGSMANSFEALQQAVIQYVESMENNEKVNIITFDESIRQVSGFLSDKNKLIEFAKKNIYQQGGTAGADAAYSVLDRFSNNDVAKTLVMMTDGEDNNPWPSEDLVSKFSEKSSKVNATIYTIGLGESLDTSYLTTIANAGAGRFIYCSDDSALTNAYNFIHKRTSSEYTITFEAEDLDLVSRYLYIEVNDDENTVTPKDLKNYSLAGEEDDDDTNVEFDTVLPDGVTIKGIDVNQLEKKNTAQTVNILGSGFEKVKITDVYIESRDGSSHCKIKSIADDKITFQVAPSVKEGTYSVFVTINNKKYKVDKLIIGNANPGEITFGAYTFNADNIVKNDNSTVLKGNVRLNDYLYFAGDVELKGNVDKDVSVTLSTGSYADVRHNVSEYSLIDSILLPAAASTRAFDRIEVVIYDDGKNYNNYEEYKTDVPWESEIGTLDLGIVSLEDNQIRIYPDRVSVKSSIGVLKDNTITDLLTNGVDFFKVDDLPAYIKGEIEAEARLMKEGPFTYFNMDISAEANSNTGLKLVDYITLEAKAGAKLMFDTYNREIGMGLSFSTKQEDKHNSSDKSPYTLCTGDAGIEFSIKGDENDRRYGDRYLNMSLALPLSITFYVEGIPVTITDLKAELSDYNINEALKNIASGRAFSKAIKSYLSSKDGAKLKVSGAIELISTNALPENVASKINKWLGDDVSLVSLDDLYGEAGINYPYLGAGATLNVLGCIQIAEMEMKLGAISYRDYVSDLLNASDGRDHYGFSFLSKQGVNFDWDLVGTDVGGEVSANVTVDRFLIAAYAKAKVAANAKISLFGTKIDVEGEAKAEACAGVWKDGKWKAHVTVVASVDGKGSLKFYKLNIAEKEVHEKATIIDEEF